MRGHVHRRGSTWTAVYDEGTREDGKRRQRTKGGFTTRKQAQAFLTAQLQRLGEGSYAAPSKLTVADYLTGEWLPAAHGTLRPLSHARYATTVKVNVIPNIGHLRLQALSPGHLNGLYRKLEQDGLSASTIRGAHTVLHRSMRDAVRWGKLTRNPATMADPPARSRSRAKAWTAGEVSRFLEQVADDRLYGLWRLDATTGMRRGELAAVTWRALDLEGARLHVDQQLLPTRGGISFGPPKSTRSRRTVALDPETVDILRRHRETQLLERAVAGDAYQDGDLVFCDELGGPIRPERLTDWFGRHRKAAGIPTGHCTRCGHSGHAGAHVLRAGAHRGRPARRRPEHRAIHVRPPAAAVRRDGGGARGGGTGQGQLMHGRDKSGSREEQERSEHQAAQLHWLGWETGAGAAIWARAVLDELARHESARESFEAHPNREAWERLHSTALLLVVAIDQVLTFERRVRKLTGAGELARAREAFDAVGPRAEALRDLVIHLDEYATGTGHRQAGQAQPAITDPYLKTYISWTNRGGTVLDLGGERLNLRTAAQAAVVLAEVVERVRQTHLKRAEEEANAALRRRYGLDS